MPAVQKSASLHEELVQSVARGEFEAPRKPRSRKPSPHGEVTVTVLNPLIRDYIDDEVTNLDLNWRCVQVISSDQAVIWNHPAPWN